MPSLERLLSRIDIRLESEHTKCNYNFKNLKSQTTIFESILNTTLGIITESIDGFIELLTNGKYAEPDEVMRYLQSSDANEVTDWINALHIVVIDRGWQGRWILSLAQKTSQLPNIPSNMRPILIEVLEALNAAPWPTTGETSPDDEEEYRQQERRRWETDENESDF